MSTQYDLYLEQHRLNVAKGYEWMYKNLPEILDYDMSKLEHQICFNHDASKIELDEYIAYDQYFYGNNKSYQVVQDFNYAWLLHIHRNPHHWQYWVLVNDDPKEGIVCLDMSYNYIIEMICDWWSFSWSNESPYDIFTWYDDHKEYIKLSENTRKTVEHILNKIKKKLDAMNNE